MSLLTIFIATFSIVVLVVFIRDTFRHVTVKKRCPVCGNQHPDRIKRSALVKSIQVLVASESYKCHACGNRFIRFGRSTAKASKEVAV